LAAVRVGVGHQPRVFDPLIGSPTCVQSEKKRCSGVKSVSSCGRGLPQRLLIRGVGRSSVRPGRRSLLPKPTCHSRASRRPTTWRRIGRRHRQRRGLEILQIFRAPPVFQVALAVELAAVVVKTMCDFCPIPSQSAVIHQRPSGFRIVEGRLQDACGKDEFHSSAVVVAFTVGGVLPHSVASTGLSELVQPRRRNQLFRSAHLIRA